jgi:hypothetical protein
MLQSKNNTMPFTDALTENEYVYVAVRRGLRDITNATRSVAAPDLPTKQNAAKCSTTTTTTLASLDSLARLPSTAEQQVLKKTGIVPQQRVDADDIDARDASDPRMVTNYVSEIYTHLREKEINCVNPTYLEHQPHINAKMRAILIDWMVRQMKTTRG